MSDIRILEYVDPQGRSPFELWFNSLNAVASAKVPGALYQLSAGNWSNVKGVALVYLNENWMWAPAIGCISARMETCS